MILIFRVDHRLLHGQVVFSWCSTLNPDCILVADDDVVNDELRKTTLKLGKPSGTKLVIKSIDDSMRRHQRRKDRQVPPVRRRLQRAGRRAHGARLRPDHRDRPRGTKSGEDKRQVSRHGLSHPPEEEALLAEAQGKASTCTSRQFRVTCGRRSSPSSDRSSREEKRGTSCKHWGSSESSAFIPGSRVRHR